MRERMANSSGLKKTRFPYLLFYRVNVGLKYLVNEEAEVQHHGFVQPYQNSNSLSHGIKIVLPFSLPSSSAALIQNDVHSIENIMGMKQ